MQCTEDTLYTSYLLCRAEAHQLVCIHIPRVVIAWGVVLPRVRQRRMHNKICPISRERHLHPTSTIIPGVRQPRTPSGASKQLNRASAQRAGELRDIHRLHMLCATGSERMVRKECMTERFAAQWCRSPVRRSGSLQGHLWAQ